MSKDARTKTIDYDAWFSNPLTKALKQSHQNEVDALVKNVDRAFDLLRRAETDAPHWSSYKQGWEDGVVQERQRIVNLLMIRHEIANGAHNYWHVAAQLIQADVASDT